MSRLSLVLVIAVLASSVALAEDGEPPLANHILRAQAKGWQVISQVGGSTTAPSPRTARVPSWDPRFKSNAELLAMPGSLVVVEARWDGRRLRDVRRFMVVTSGEELVLELSPRAFVARPVPLRPHREFPGDRRAKPVLQLGKGWKVDVLSEGDWVDVRVHGPQGGMIGQVPSSALEREIAGTDPEFENDPFDYTGTLPQVALLPEGPQAVSVASQVGMQLFESSLRPWHVVSPLATLFVSGLHRQRPGLAWVEVRGPGNSSLWAFAAVSDLVASDPAYPPEVRLQLLASAGSGDWGGAEQEEERDSGSSGKGDGALGGVGLAGMIQGGQAQSDESKAESDRELLGRCVAVSTGPFWDKVQAQAEERMRATAEGREELQRLQLKAARRVLEAFPTARPVTDVSDFMLRSAAEEVLGTLGHGMSTQIGAMLAGERYSKEEIEAFGDLREEILAAL